MSTELTDPLTGIFNNRYLCETLPVEVERARLAGRSLSVVVAGLDQLEQINKTHGPGTGAAVLQQIVSLMRSSLRHADWMARYGGEEFVVVLPETHIEGAYAAAERMRRRCTEKPFALSASQIVVTASFGVASIDASAKEGDINAMLQEAGEALRASKLAGRNRVTCTRTATNKISQRVGPREFT